LAGRCSHSDGVGAKPGVTAKSGHHQHSSVGHRDADHVAIQGHHGIVTGDAVVIRVAHGDKAGAVCGGLFDGQLHGPIADGLSKAGPGVNQGGGGAFADHLFFRASQHHAILEALDVTSQPGHTVRVDAAQVGG
jgi:hypothetical protein